MRKLFAFGMIAVFAFCLGSEVIAQDVSGGGLETRRYRNLADSTIFRYDVVEFDTNATYVDNALFLPDTFTVDSLTTSPNALGPFQLKITMVGTASTDTFWVVGTARPKRNLFASSASSITEKFIGATDSEIHSNYVWETITAVQTPTTGLDSLRLLFTPINGVQLADTLDLSVVGVVLSDSVQNDSVGTFAVRGPVGVRVTTDSPVIELGQAVSAGLDGAVAGLAAATAADTIGAVQVQLSTQIGRALGRSAASTADTILIDLNLPSNR